MDAGTTGSWYTVIVFVCFIGVVLWAFSRRNKKSFDEAANLVFDDEKPTPETSNEKQEKSANE